MTTAWTFSPADGVPAPVAPYSHAVAAGNLLFVTGQMPLVPETHELTPGGIGPQTDQVMANLAKVLELSGSSWRDVVMVRAYLTDFGDYAAFNEAYAAWLSDPLPARTCVSVTGLAVGALVEIDVVAVRT